MEFYEAVNARRTVREFENAPLEDAALERILSAGMKAPTNDHMRDWHFVVVREKSRVLRLIEKIPMAPSSEEIETVLRDWNLKDPCQQSAYRNAIPRQYRMFADASCVVAPLLKQKTDLLHPENLSHLNGFASIWCCVENIFLAATAEGYACALRIPLGEESAWAQTVLQFPKDYQMPCLIAIGKPRPEAAAVAQRPYSIRQRIHENQW